MWGSRTLIRPQPAARTTVNGRDSIRSESFGDIGTPCAQGRWFSPPSRICHEIKEEIVTQFVQRSLLAIALCLASLPATLEGA
jgi:hypothetical protein